MAIVIIRQDNKTEQWKAALEQAAPDIRFYSYEDAHPKEEIAMALVWKPPFGSLSEYKNLKCIASFGAGVDFLFEDSSINPDIPITRVVDPFLADDMSEFVIAKLMAYLKNLDRYKADQVNGIWNPISYKRIVDECVGIMGFGALGKVLASDLQKMNFEVIAWVSRPRKESNLRIYGGLEQLGNFLSRTTVLVCLLPLTDATKGILNRQLFEKLPKGAYIINVARGGHLVDKDLIEMLDINHLSGASLDVFHEEPLPKEHPFWSHQKVHLTPHIASVSDVDSVVPQLLDNYQRLLAGEPLKNRVSREKQY